MKRFTYMPRGGWERPSEIGAQTYGEWLEMALTILRHGAAELDKRAADPSRPRCKRCFTKGWIAGGYWTVCHGCDGCAEAFEALHALWEHFARKPRTDGEEAR